MRSWRRRIVSAALGAVVALGIPAVAVGAGITLDRVPSPPQAIALGTGEQISFSITYTSVAKRYVLTVTPPGQAARTVVDQSPNQIVPGLGSPITGAPVFTPGPADSVGRYGINLQFFSDAGLESTATTIFDVAAQLGTLTITKYEDVNGNGTRDPGEPGLPGWVFNLVNPSGGTSTTLTGADGTVTIPNVPAGTWTITEVLQPGWFNVSPLSGQVLVPANGTGTFTVGNARPGILSGLVFVDNNRNGALDAGEVGRAGVTIDLTGRTGLNRPANPASTQTGGDGTYNFPNLYPGTYSVTMKVPDGFVATTPTTIANRSVPSGGTNPNNNFGIAPALAPTLGVDKTGPARADAGDVVPYRITVRNPSRSVTARDVVLRDPIPRYFTLPAGEGTGENVSVINGVVTWRLGNLAPQQARTVTLRLRLSGQAPEGTYRNTAIASARDVSPRRDSADTTYRAPQAPTRRAVKPVTG
jgi:uncharacterized repeat protein (TIGR01451 family)